MKQTMQYLTSKKSVEHYTPKLYIDLAKEVMGSIDLDPASNELAQRTVQAASYYTSNGLEQPWYGNVWLNPPYNGHAKHWTKKIVASYQNNEISQGIVLCFAKLGYNWFRDLIKVYPTCLFYDRIHFINEQTMLPAKSKAPHGSAFVYLGDNTEKFKGTLRAYGSIVEDMLI